MKLLYFLCHATIWKLGCGVSHVKPTWLWAVCLRMFLSSSLVEWRAVAGRELCCHTSIGR